MRLCGAKTKCIMSLFVLCLFLCGICVDKIQVAWVSNSVVTAQGDTLTCRSLSSQNLWSMDELMLQQPSLRSYMSIKRDSMRVVIRVFTYLLSSMMFLQITLACLWRQERRLWAAAESHGRIICFIHQKDGEKEEHILPVCL